MCEYTGSVDDPLRHANIQLTDEEITEAVNKMLNEPEHICTRTGLLPFCATNKPPAVRVLIFLFTEPVIDISSHYLISMSV